MGDAGKGTGLMDETRVDMYGNPFGDIYERGVWENAPPDRERPWEDSSLYTYEDFLEPQEPGGKSMFATAVPLIAQGIGGLFGWFGGKRQDAAQRRQQAQRDRQWDEMFAFQKAVRLEDQARYQAAVEAQSAYLAHEEAKSHGQWASRVDARSPYRAASRAILGKTMGMDVPAYRPRYAMGDAPRESPYQDYIAPRNRERSA